MPNLSYPGVYVQEVSSGVRPIAAASTSTAAFVGQAEKGPDEEAKRITSWSEFQRYYGSFIDGSYLAESVFQFFNNGGSQCYVVRVTRSDAVPAETTVENREAGSVAGIKFSANSKGAWANHLVLEIGDGSTDPGNTFQLKVRHQETADVIPSDFQTETPLEIHDGLGMDRERANYFVDVLARGSDLIVGEDLIEADPSQNPVTTHLQPGIHRGGLDPEIPQETELRKLVVNVDYDGTREITLPAELADLDAVATAITDLVKALTPNKATNAPAFSDFLCDIETVTVAEGDKPCLRLRSGTNTGAGTENRTSSVRVQNASTGNAATALKLGESNGGRSEDALAVRRPVKATAVQVGDAAVASPVTAANPGADGETEPDETGYEDAFKYLDNKTDFSLLAVPGIGTEIMVNKGMNYCCNRRSLQDVFYVGEMKEDDDTPDEAATFRRNLTVPNSYGAVYFPWIKALDPSGKARGTILLPPSGYVAGLYARIDNRRGVWKAPAGTEASLGGAVGLAIDLTDVQQGNLNLINVNCLRRFPAAGIVSWGARTVTSDPEYKYVPVRRMAIFLRVSIFNGIQWAVFEPNDEPLWASLRLNIGSFMTSLFRQGAFQGASPAQAFFVKVDGETTSQADIDNGIVNILIGFAPLKPAEFVVVKISQMAGQSS